MSARLRQRIVKHPSCSVWQAIRHYIGRLGSWWNACSILVSTAQCDPRIFLATQVKPVRQRASPGETHSHEIPRPTHVECPPSTSQEKERWSSSTPLSLVRQWGDNATTEFTNRARRRQAEKIVHAELLVLDHFYQHNLEFAEGVRYIGCSKLSCYCCLVYMKVHPLAVLARPCHGNTWTRWAMPARPSDQNEQSRDHDTRLLTEMIRQTSHDIEAGSFDTTMVRCPESTTGIDPEF